MSFLDIFKKKKEVFLDRSTFTKKSAQAAYDIYVLLKKEGRSEAELFTEHGFNLKRVVEPMLEELERVKNELEKGEKVESDYLDIDKINQEMSND